MKKLLFFLTLIVVWSVLSGVLASKARVRHIIFGQDPISTERCNVTLVGKSIIPSAFGTFYATTLFNASCVTAMTFDLDN